MARILVIDDTRNIQKMVKLTLEHAGHSVETANDGAQGLVVFGDGSAFDLILVDQQMPQVEGREVVVEARRRDPQARLVMMTAFATTELATEVLQSGASDFLRKPFTTADLRATVETVLAQPRGATVSGSADAASPPAALTSPGEAGFTLPRVSFRAGGYSFWPAADGGEQAEPGLEFGRVFQIRHPDGHLSRCFVGITAHIREQMRREAPAEIAANDPFWENFCGQALLNFLWEKAAAPPEVLPVYEKPKTSRTSSHTVPWGPFAVG